MITDSYDIYTEPVISVSDIYGEQKHMTDICIITFSEVIYKTILRDYNCTKIAEIGFCNGNIPIYSFKYKDREIAFYLSEIGSALASQCVIDANILTGAKKFIMFGSAGSLDFEKTNGRFVIPTHAYRDEGMSYHYAPPSDYITVRNSGVIKDIFDEIRVPYAVGRTWTTDAMFRETRGQMKKRKEEGCIAVEMEIAGVQSVCDFHNLELYTFIVTGDILSDSSYTVGTLNDANHNIDKFKLALEIAGRI